MSWNDLPGLGSATGTRVDSAAKHIMACKVDTRLLACWVSPGERNDALNCMHADKMKWCMNKDEVVLNTCVNSDEATVKAYPLVVTTVGDMRDNVQNYLKTLYGKTNPSAFVSCRKWVDSNNGQDVIELKKACGFADAAARAAVGTVDYITPDVWNPILAQLKTLPDFRCQGIALGQAWASYLSGDTVASVLVGGMVTVQNGHFTMHTGDLVQWYFDFEKDKFSSKNKDNGARLSGDPEAPLANRRHGYMDERLYGSALSLNKGSGYKKSESVVRIKSYRMHTVKHTQVQLDAGIPPNVVDNIEHFVQDHYGDKMRVFAKCISGGRPFDAVDIMLMTQSL